MACFVTRVADRFIVALAGNMPRLLAIPAQGLFGALGCNVPWKCTIVADSYIGTVSSIVSRTLTVFAEIIPVATAFPPVRSVTIGHALSSEQTCSRRASAAFWTHTDNPTKHSLPTKRPLLLLQLHPLDLKNCSKKGSPPWAVKLQKEEDEIESNDPG